MNEPISRPRFEPVDLSSVTTYSIGDRPTKVDSDALARPTVANPTVAEFAASLPSILKAVELRQTVDALVDANRNGRPVVLGMGGHVIKCGLGGLLVELIEDGLVQAVAMNGGASIHDFELATIGRTSEDVATTLHTGMFGLVEETGRDMNAAINDGWRQGWGMGQSLGEHLLATAPPWMRSSVLAAGARLGVPVTVHAAIGSETIHMHPAASGAAIGETSMVDFRLLASVLTTIGDGGVFMNLGSAVIIPEVFLKALNVARNVTKSGIRGFTTVNLDMQQHYRPVENVVRRPQGGEGRGYTITGHHEIMIPLVFTLYRARLGDV